MRKNCESVNTRPSSRTAVCFAPRGYRLSSFSYGGLFSHFQMAVYIPSRENPRRMTLIPAHGGSTDQPARVVQQEIAAERQARFDDIECY